jgi:hypothetical protein
MALPTHFWKKTLISVCIILACLLVGYILGRCDGRKSVKTAENKIVCDTVTYVDTIKYIKPIIKDSLITRYETVKLPVVNGNNGGENIPNLENIAIENIPDSAKVLIPITQAVYQDSTYTAWISGYHTTLDSIYVVSTRDVVTIKKPPNRWHIGVSAGYGYTPSGFQPWIGVGVTYSLLNF